MGGGSYSYHSHTSRIIDKGFTSKSTHEIFQERQINNAMNPYGVSIRESRDSNEHPNSVAIIFALDETGSMGSVPHFLVKEGLPEIMNSIIEGGIKDPQVLFMGIGDHECDDSPLQVGQFESSDELLEHWLTKIYLEGNGGGNAGESYHLAWYFAGYHTEIDCFEKRGQKGFLFTIGDEPVLPDLPKSSLNQIMGKGQYEDFSNYKLLEKAMEKYHVFHIHIKETSSGQRQRVMDSWKQLIGDNLLIAENRRDVQKIIVETIQKYQVGQQNINEKVKEKINIKTDEMML